MSWPVRIATLKKGGADALHGVQVQAARSPGRTFFRNGLRRSTALTDVATVTRATQAWGVDQGGNVAAVAAGQPVVNTAGLSVYEARTNSLRNPTGLGAVAGTPGTLPTNWSEQIASGLTRQVVGTGTENGRPYVDIRLFGTTAAPGNTILFFEASGIIAAANAQVWTGDLGLAVVGGTQANVSAYAHRAELRDSGGGFLTSDTYGSLTPTSARAQMRGTYTVANASAAYIRPGLSVYHAAAAAVDITLRIYAPNLKAGADIGDPPILQTTNAAATRNADVITEAVNIPVGQSFTVTGKVIAPASQTYNQFVFVLDDGQSTPTNLLRVNFNAGALLAKLVAGGIETSIISLGTIAAGAPVGIALSVEGSTVAFSVNGVEVVTQTMAGPFAAALTRLCLGHYPGGSNQLNSTLRDLAITMRAFTSAERQAASDVTLTHDLDFVSQVYQYVGAPYVTPTDLPRTTFSRASTGYADNAAGAAQSFAAGVLRVTNLGALFEASATNVLPYSFDDTPTLIWSNLVGATVATGSLAPRVPGATVTLMTTTTTNGRIQRNIVIPNDSQPRVFTVDVEKKAGTYEIGVGAVGGSPTVGTTLLFNSLTGAVTSGSGVIEDKGAWWRVSVAFTNNSTGNTTAYAYVQANGAAGTTAQVALPDMEVGANSTSYKPSRANTNVTRAADALVSTMDPNPSAYTVFAEFTIPLNGPTYGHVFGMDDGTGNNNAIIYFDRAAGNIYAVVNSGGATQAALNLGAATPGQTYKAALRVAANDFAAIKTGGTIATDASGAVPSTTFSRVGQSTGPGNPWNGPIRRIRRWSVGKTNSELQALVA